MLSLIGAIAIAGLYLGGVASATSPTESVMLSAKDVIVDKHTSSGWGHAPKHNYTFETVKGFFLQDFDSTNNTGFDFIASNFGLASSAPLAWKAFDWSVKELNKQAPHNVSYRVLYLARHGEGWHNVAESFYGTPAWNDKWSKLNTDGNMTWGPDAQLTPLGISQAQNASAAWKTQSAAGAPLPQSFYSSPLTRSSDTLNVTWSSVPGVLIGNSKHAPVPVVLEGLRETIGVHTCDKRHPKTWIAQREPKWVFEKGFTEEDELWTADDRESDGAQQARIREALVQILDNDDSTYISITAHSGTVAAALRAIGHRAFSLATGAMIPVVIKATKQHVGDI